MRKCEQNWINGTNCKTSQGDDDDDDGYCQLAAVAATSDHCSKFTIANWRACALCNVHKCENVEHECRVAKSHIVADEGGNEGMHRGGKYRHMKNWQSEQNRYVIACRCIESSSHRYRCMGWPRYTGYTCHRFADVGCRSVAVTIIFY